MAPVKFTDLGVIAARLIGLTCAVLLALVATWSSIAQATEIEFIFESSTGVRYPNVVVRGQCDLNSKAILTSDANGRWKFDTNELSCTNGIIAFSGVNAGVQLLPAEVSVADLVSQGTRSKKILATPSASPSAIVSWSFFSSYSSRLASLPVGLLNPYGYSAAAAGSSCSARHTDLNGYVLWSVPKASAACTDSSPSTSWYHIVPVEGPQMQCSAFTTSGAVGSRACPVGDVQGVSTATCSIISPPAQSLTSTIRVSIKAAGTTYGVLGAELVGNSNFMSLTSRQTNSLGEFSFRIGSVPGAQASTVFDIAPVKVGYEFFPRMRSTKECAYIGSNTYQCEFSGVPTSAGQGAVLVDIKQAGRPLSGAQLIPPDGGLGCNPSAVSISDATGTIVLPVRTRASCASTSIAGLSTGTSWSDVVPVYPSMKGKAFLSPTQFLYCPTTLITSAPITAYDDNSAVQNYSISGRVLDVAGAPLAGAEIYVNGSLASTTAPTGDFLVGPYAQGTTVTVEARSGSLLFDPTKQTFLELGDHQQLLIHARAPDPYSGGTEPPEEFCPLKDQYSVGGLVLDLEGRPLADAKIYLNDDESPIATSDRNGQYSLMLPDGSDNWLSIDYDSKKFSPSGRSINGLDCDSSKLDFQEVLEDSVLLSGSVVDSGGVAMPDVSIDVWINGMPVSYGLKTSAEGIYRLAVPQGAAVGIVASKAGFSFTPERLEIDAALADEVLAAFAADGSIFTTPTPSATSTPSSNPPLGPLPTSTPGGGSPSPGPISGPPSPPGPGTPIQGPIGTATAAPPGSQPGTPTVTPTATSTPGGSVPTPLSTATMTPSPEQGTPPGPLPTATPTPFQEPPAPVPTSTPNAPATETAIPSPVPTDTPDNSPVSMPKLQVNALCNSTTQDGLVYWVVENVGRVSLGVGNAYVQHISQTNVKIFEGSIVNLASGDKTIFVSKLAGNALDTYRLNIEAQVPSSGEFVSVSGGLVKWDPNRCVAFVPPAPTPVPYVVTVIPTTAPPGASPTVTPTVTAGPTQPPSGQPTSAPVVQPTATPMPGATMTATPEPTYRLAGSVRSGKRGTRISKALMRRLIDAGAYVEIRGRLGSTFLQKIQFAALQKDGYETWLPGGSYSVSVQSTKNVLRVTSLFKKNSQRAVVTFSNRKKEYTNVSFAVAFRSVITGGGAQ